MAETAALLAELGDEAKILAGGLSLVPMMDFRDALGRPGPIADLPVTPAAIRTSRP